MKLDSNNIEYPESVSELKWLIDKRFVASFSSNMAIDFFGAWAIHYYGAFVAVDDGAWSGMDFFCATEQEAISKMYHGFTSVFDNQDKEPLIITWRKQPTVKNISGLYLCDMRISTIEVDRAMLEGSGMSKYEYVCKYLTAFFVDRKSGTGRLHE